MLALAILTAIVTTLASSGLWGLYRYRQLATSVSQRAAEIPQIIALTHDAQTLRDTFHRIHGLRRPGGPLSGEHLLAEYVVKSEKDHFAYSLEEFKSVLERYELSLQDAATNNDIFVDHALQQQILASIHGSLDDIDDLRGTDVSMLGPHEFGMLQQELDELNDMTQRLPAFLQSRMSGFRDEVRGDYRTWITLAWSCVILSIGMVGILLWLFRSLVVLPFRNLLSGCRLVASGQFDHRIDLGTGDELAELADAMNNMTDRFQHTCGELEQLCDSLDQQVSDRTREVIQREQLASVGFLAAGVAHEINNPLATIAWSAEALESRLHDAIHHAESGRALTRDEAESLKTNLRRVQEEAFRCKGITERLLDFSRLGDVTFADADIGHLIEDVVAMVSTLGQYRCKTISVDCPDSVSASVNAQEIRQVVLNLLTNALESVQTDGAVRVEVRRKAGNVVIAVCDNGCGMTQEVTQHLFEPFFTRRRDGRGTGLGLSITFQIVSRHGGVITAHSAGPGCGSRLEVTLPLQRRESNSDESRQAA